MRRGTMIGASLVVALFLVALADAAGAPREGRCVITLVAAKESHGARLGTKCGFAQQRLRIRASSVIYHVSPRPKLQGPVDPGDGFHCGNRDRPHARCLGSAGRGVRVGTYVQTKGFSCDVAYTVRVTGGTDCDPPLSCDQVGYEARRRFDRPSGCGR